MNFKFFLTADEDGTPDVLFINDMWVGPRFRARAFLEAFRGDLELLAEDPDSGVTKHGEGRFMLGGPLP